MRLQTAVDQRIQSEVGSKANIQVGISKNYNPRARTIDIETVEGGVAVTYSGLVIPSLGLGLRPSTIKDGTHIAFCFVGNNRDFPIIISFLTGNGLGPTEAEDVSVVGSIGRLSMRQYL